MGLAITSFITVQLTSTSNHEFLLLASCRQEMRFQFSFEGLSVCSSFNFFWQLIPDAWRSDGEGTFIELQSRPPGNKVIFACRAVQSSARYQRCRLNQILDLEFNPLLNWQPLERSECLCHAIS